MIERDHLISKIESKRGQIAFEFSATFSSPKEELIESVFMEDFERKRAVYEDFLQEPQVLEGSMDHTFNCATKVITNGHTEKKKQFDSLLFAINQDKLVISFSLTKSKSLKEPKNFYNKIKPQCKDLHTMHSGNLITAYLN